MQRVASSFGWVVVASLASGQLVSGCIPSRQNNTASSAPQQPGYNPASPYGTAPYNGPGYGPQQPTGPGGYAPSPTTPSPQPTAAPTNAPTSAPAPASPFPFPFPTIPGWGAPFPFPGSAPTSSPAPTTGPGPGPGPSPTSVPGPSTACIVSSTPQTFRTSLQISAFTGLCDQRPKLNGSLTIRATGATTAHLDWNGGEYSDDASLDPSTCTVSHAPPGKTQQVDGVTGHASYKITIDTSGRVSGTAHVNVDIPFAACHADYNVAGSK